jgi:chromate transporter
MAGVIGFVGGRAWPNHFLVLKGHGQSKTAGPESVAAAAEPALRYTEVRPTLGRAVRVSAVFLTLWFGPIVVMWLTLGPSSVYYQEGVFFSQAAVVTFGGAYSVLAYIAQQAVEKYGWLGPGEMLTGLSMAETTPGPLIMVVQFVGFMAAYRYPGPLTPLAAGIVGSAITTWVTFVPCFFWIFLGAPYIERLRGNRLLTAALSAITAAVVGVVLNLAVWFALHTLFEEVTVWQFYRLRVDVPDPASVNVAACVIALVACLLTFYWKKGMAVTLGISAGLGLAAYFLAMNVR